MKKLRITFADGSERQYNPFTGAEVWYTPGRNERPVLTIQPDVGGPLADRSPEDYCNFCPANMLNTTPEKARITFRHKLEKRETPESIFSSPALFRRITNLYPILHYKYWQTRYGYVMPAETREWMESYLRSSQGKEHIRHLLRIKKGDRANARWQEGRIAEQAAFLFDGSHDLIIPHRHYVENAKTRDLLASPGELSAEEHYHYFHFTLATLKDLHRANPHIKFVCVYQNWLKEAGASFQHLHRQMLGTDTWGKIIERKIKLELKERGIFNRLALNWGHQNNLIVCENETVVALAEVGHPFPTIAVYSKSAETGPEEFSPKHVRDMSDLVHALHKAGGALKPTNEEWYYTPRNSNIIIPWHILIKWRTNIVAGFEGATHIFINPLAPEEWRDRIGSQLKKLIANGQIQNVSASPPFSTGPNDLAYCRT